VRNEFRDPRGVKPTYVWHIGHDTEDNGGRGRSVSATPVVGGARLILQQGENEPLKFQLSGTILEPAQLQAFNDWYALGQTQTIYWRDFAGDLFEVLITEFRPVRKRTARNPRTGQPWYWTYRMEITVVRVISSSTWAGSPA
jgi:hypothetical protein